jgi:hypothetical protein
VVEEFWVDVYIDPHTPPTVVNQTWDQLGSQGLVWAVLSDALPNLVPGGTITLSVGDAYYQAEYSQVSWPLPVGTDVYAQVDSLNLDTTYGAVEETHEIVGERYNNIVGPVFSTASAGQVPMPTTSSRLIPSVNLPRRP